VFHWLLAVSLLLSWLTAELGYDWTEQHFLLGYCALGLILFRLAWGFCGTHHARFSQFLAAPRVTLTSLRQVFSRQPSNAPGHTAIGGWSAVLMLLLVAVQATTGLFISDDIFYAGPYNGVISGEWAGRLAQIHHINFTLLQVVVVVHILAISWYGFGKRQNLTATMVTGRKPWIEARAGIASSQLWRALVLAILVGAAVTALVQLAPPPPMDDYF
jgi:cytochrome b